MSSLFIDLSWKHSVLVLYWIDWQICNHLYGVCTWRPKWLPYVGDVALATWAGYLNTIKTQKSKPPCTWSTLSRITLYYCCNLFLLHEFCICVLEFPIVLLANYIVTVSSKCLSTYCTFVHQGVFIKQQQLEKVYLFAPIPHTTPHQCFNEIWLTDSP